MKQEKAVEMRLGMNPRGKKFLELLYKTYMESLSIKMAMREEHYEEMFDSGKAKEACIALLEVVALAGSMIQLTKCAGSLGLIDKKKCHEALEVLGKVDGIQDEFLEAAKLWKEPANA